MVRCADYIWNNIIIADEVNTTKQYAKKAQVGVDLSVKEIRPFLEAGYTLKGKTYAAKTKALEKIEFEAPDGNTYRGYFIPKGSYILTLNEGCKFGPNDTGYIILRSSLNRSAVSVCSAVWDPGYHSINEDGSVYPMSIRLTVENEHGFYLEENSRVAQLIVFENENATLYNGQWQGGETVSKLV